MRTLLVLLSAGLLTACSAAMPTDIDGPADPVASVLPTRYLPVMAGTKDYEPRDPKPWIGEATVDEEDE
jgi:hypothetical protein